MQENRSGSQLTSFSAHGGSHEENNRNEETPYDELAGVALRAWPRADWRLAISRGQIWSITVVHRKSITRHSTRWVL
jgi:hypothetical protein